MNNYITSFKNWFLRVNKKGLNWFKVNKRLFLIWFYVIMGSLFIISFSLWIMAGVGFKVDVNGEPGDHPDFNGYWFIQPYIGTGKQLMGTTVSRWEYLSTTWTLGHDDGYRYWAQYANQSYTLYLMFNATLPIWATSLCIVVVFNALWAFWKYAINPWVKKNLEKLNNSDNINIENQVVNQ